MKIERKVMRQPIHIQYTRRRRRRQSHTTTIETVVRGFCVYVLAAHHCSQDSLLFLFVGAGEHSSYLVESFNMWSKKKEKAERTTEFGRILVKKEKKRIDEKEY